MKKQIIMIVAAMSFAITGCQGSTSASSNTKTTTAVEETSEEETQPETEAWSEEEELALYNKYIGINNYMVGRINDSLTRYFNYVEYQEEFANKEQNYYCYSLSSDQIKRVGDTYTIAEAKSEKTELDEAFLRMYPSIIEVMGCLNDIEEYTDMKSYLDDDYGKGKELHAVLWKFVNEYTETGDAFMAALSVEANIKREAGMQQLKDEGYETLYAINRVMYSAQAIQEELFHQGVSDENILDMNLEIIQPLYEEFVADVEKVMELSEDKEKLEKEGISMGNMGNLSLFKSSMKHTKTSMTEVLDKVKEGKPLDQYDLMVSNLSGHCSLTSFYSGISEMIGHYNNMIR